MGMSWTDIVKYASYATPFIPGVNVASPYIIAGATALDEAYDAKKANEQATQQLQGGNTAATNTYKESFSPYMNLGSQSANTLAGLMGFAPLQDGAAQQAAPAQAQAQEPYATRVRPEDSSVIGHAQARGTLADLGQDIQSRAQTRSSFVRMRAPNGEEDDVPQSAVKHFTDLGGMVVG